MNTKITENAFKYLYPTSKRYKEIVNSLNKLLPQYDINTEKRISAFISQCGHESGNWKVFEENLNYSRQALTRVFGKYFSETDDSKLDPLDYARNPEKIANVVYANRMGNGDTESGEGWLYRGRGPIQLTGKYNYEKFKEWSGVDVISNPDIIVKDLDVGILSAIWFWHTKNLNELADMGNVTKLTRKINGGLNGLADRKYHYDLCLDHFQTGCMTNTKSRTVVKLGDKGYDVRVLQMGINVIADGIFGPGTKKALMEWQAQHGLESDGIAGPNTWRHIRAGTRI